MANEARLLNCFARDIFDRSLFEKNIFKLVLEPACVQLIVEESIQLTGNLLERKAIKIVYQNRES